mgnify:CR=1 FL=1
MDVNTDLIVFPRLPRKGQISLLKQRKQWGRPHLYFPHKRTIDRIARELGWTFMEVHIQMDKERAALQRLNLIPSVGWYRGKSHSDSGY